MIIMAALKICPPYFFISCSLNWFWELYKRQQKRNKKAERWTALAIEIGPRVVLVQRPGLESPASQGGCRLTKTHRQCYLPGTVHVTGVVAWETRAQDYPFHLFHCSPTLGCETRWGLGQYLRESTEPGRCLESPWNSHLNFLSHKPFWEFKGICLKTAPRGKTRYMYPGRKHVLRQL